MNVPFVAQLAELMERFALTSLTYKDGGEDGSCEIVLSREPTQSAAPTVTNAPQVNLSFDGADIGQVVSTAPQTQRYEPEAKTEPARDGRFIVVRSPIVGTAYRAREPGGAPLVSVGDAVKKGDALCVLEAMKFFSDVVAPEDGRVAEIAFTDGALAEYDAPLVVLEKQ